MRRKFKTPSNTDDIFLQALGKKNLLIIMNKSISKNNIPKKKTIICVKSFAKFKIHSPATPKIINTIFQRRRHACLSKKYCTLPTSNY